jgi:hypothetical protein
VLRRKEKFFGSINSSFKFGLKGVFTREKSGKKKK